MANLSEEEKRAIDQEVLECARYGEDEDLKEMLRAGGNVNYRDGGGNTALHKAAANNHVSCLKVLKEHSALYVPNDSGNLPIHWAAQNKALDALKFLFENYGSLIDVLATNKNGLSTLTEAFNSGDSDVIAACLEHPTSSEEKLLSGMDKKQFSTKDDIENDNNPSEEKDVDGNIKPHGAVDHIFNFSSGEHKTLFLRELPISRADNPFGNEQSPEDDTTGLGVWPASILMARYVVQMKAILEGKIVAELGCGCGLPGLAGAVYCKPKKMYLTDIHEPTLANLKYNAIKNNFKEAENVSSDEKSVFRMDSDETVVEVLNVNWKDPSSYPSDSIDVILGSDLVYDSAILRMLVPALETMLSKGGTFLYCAPDNARDGMEEFVSCLEAAGLTCVNQQPCSDEMFANPFDSQDDDQYVLHFYDLSAKVPHTLYHFVKS